MQPQYEVNLSEIKVVKEKLNNLINQNVCVTVNDGSVNNPKYNKFIGQLSLVSNNIFAIKQNLGPNYCVTKTFMINGILINKIKVEKD